MELFPADLKLVCESCWRTVFSFDAFQAAWGPASSSPQASYGGGEFSYITPPREQMVQNATHGCQWCKLVCDEIRTHRLQGSDRVTPPLAPDETSRMSVRFEARTPEYPMYLWLSKLGDDGWSLQYLVLATPGDNAARYITERELVRQMDTPDTYALVMKCIEDCIQHHPGCPSPSLPTDMPTRVIDCADPVHPRLYISNRADAAFYVALSYVWGEDQPHRTTTTSLTSYIAGINMQYIPSTIRDAITVTHKLGLRYLWVDAFCIIQDSEEDKAVEISRIKSVFRNAYITIIAASAGKVSEGFLHDRAAADPPVPLPFRCPDGTVGTMLLQPEDFAPSEPINSRAWCLEERVLSPRALLYCTHTLQYECQTSHINVNGGPSFVEPIDGIPRLPDRVFVPHASEATGPADGVHDIDDAWTEIVRLYTTRALTSPRDRLLALSGVAEQFHQFWQGSRYICGMWDHQLPRCLLWFVTPADSERLLRPQRYRAPSWSWAAVDGAILPAVWGKDDDVLCTARWCDVTLAWNDRPYGEVVAGELVLDAMVRKAVCDPTASLDRGVVKPLLFEENGGPEGVENLQPGSRWYRPRSSRGEIGDVRLDAVGDISEQESEVYVVIVVYGGRHAFRGLVVVPCGTNGAQEDDSDVPLDGTAYRRVGTFTAAFSNRAAWLATPRRQIRIR